MKKIILTSFSLLLVLLVFAQVSTVDSLPKENLNWYNKSPKNDGILGVEVDRAYAELLNGKTAKKTIIVAVIDGGVDPQHEDLKERMWINNDEIPDNGIDDDNNGYIDDIYGWNFLGNAKGENINEENLEVTRIVRRLNPKYGNKVESDIAESDKEEFKTYQKALAELNELKTKYTAKQKSYAEILEKVRIAEEALSKEISGDLTLESVQAFSTEDSTLLKYKMTLENLYGRGIDAKYLEYIVNEYFGMYVNSYTNLDFNPRSDIIGDNVLDINDMKGYGNPDVKGEDASHGSMVSGIIGGVRNNNIGVNGVADSVRFMALRAIPNGDEQDKDVALAIRYAVDNGANVINMSFGKYYSPIKGEVDAAMKYAQDKGVLMIAASGNNNKNVDKEPHFPTPYMLTGETLETFIMVGANDQKVGKTMAGDFSNYGQKGVHIFAPGVGIISTSPDNTYEMANGTSFACPVATGVAALVWSFYPELTAAELKDILLTTGSNYKKQKIYEPGYSEEEYTKTKFGKISSTGSIVNAYNALQAAEKKLAEK